MSTAEKARLLGRAREVAGKASPGEQAWAWAALALAGEPEDVSRADLLTESKDSARAQLVANLVRAGLLREAGAFFAGVKKPGPRGLAGIALAPKVPALALDGIAPRHAATIALLLAARGILNDPQSLLRSQERAADELERCAVLLHGAALLVFMGRSDEAQRVSESLPAWAVDELHLTVVDTYARANRAEEARAYANSLPEDTLKLESFLRLLEHSDDRITRIRAQSMLNLGRVPRSYALRLARRTKASIDIERAESFVWQDADDGSPSAALALVELGELCNRTREPERALEYLRNADETHPTAQAAAFKLGGLWAQLQAPVDSLQALPASLREKAHQGAIPVLAKTGNAAQALALSRDLRDLVPAIKALTEAALAAPAETATAVPVLPLRERSLSRPDLSALRSETTPAPRLEPLPVAVPLRPETGARFADAAPVVPEPPRAEPEAEGESRTNLRSKVKPDEPTPAPSSPVAQLLHMSPSSLSEDDATSEGRRRRPSAGLESLLNEVPDSIPVRPDTLGEMNQPAPAPRPPTTDGWVRGRLESKTPGADRAGLLKNRDSDGTLRPESSAEQARRLAARVEADDAPEVWRALWLVTRDTNDLAEARAAAEGRPASLSALGVSFARAGQYTEAHEISRALPDGALRGAILTAIAKDRATQGDLTGAEAEMLSTNDPEARAAVLLAVAEAAPTLDRIEDAERTLARASSPARRLVDGVALLYALAGRPARALLAGGESARLPIARRLGAGGRREEAARYLDGMEDPVRRAEGHIALVAKNQEDAFFVQALASLDAIEPRRRLRPALLLAKASGRPTDTARAKLLAERLLVREEREALPDLLLLWELSRERSELDALLALCNQDGATKDPATVPTLRALAPLLQQEDPGGRLLLETIEGIADPALRALFAEAGARALAQSKALEPAVRAARLSPNTTFTAYGLLAVAASLRGQPSPYEPPDDTAR